MTKQKEHFRRSKYGRLFMAGSRSTQNEVYEELMKRKSFRESTPRTREEKLKRALAYRKRTY